MVADPYKTLGISPGASLDEIKKAYRQKAKEYHPDLHPNDPKAAEKMNEVNEAYDMLLHPEKYRARQQQSSQSGQGQHSYWQGQSHQYTQGGFSGWQSSGDWFDFENIFGFGAQRSGTVPPPREEPQDSGPIRSAVFAIQQNRFSDAITTLAGIPGANRNARWHYLFALAQHGAGNSMTALEEIQRAYQMEPGNPLYAQVLQNYRSASQAYDQRAQGFNMRATDPTRLCIGLCLANLLCNSCCRGGC